MRKTAKRIEIDSLPIENIAAEGRGLGRWNGKVVFVDYAVPGDVVRVQSQVVKKDFVVGKIKEILEPAPYRREAVCTHFGTCGGCRWQHVPYEQQLKFKQQLVQEAFDRIGKLEYPSIQTIVGAPHETYYRNKLEFTFSGKGWLTQDQIESGADIDRRALGFHVPGRFDAVMQIDHCYLQETLSNSIRNFVHQFAMQRDWSFYNMSTHEGFLRNLILRNTLKNEWMVTVSFGENIPEQITELLDALDHEFPQIQSLNYVVNTKMNDTLYDQDIITYKGAAFILETLGHMTYKIGPKSFFQTNSLQASVLYDLVRKMAALKPDDHVYDLYTGTGTIALYLSRDCKKVVGIETIEDAIKDAHYNADLNKVNNADFVAAQVEKILDSDFIQQYGRPDVVVTDPPRAGMHEKVLDVLLEAAPRKIVYVSCNPATQARDLQRLSEKYVITAVQPVDMFPHTYHIENIVSLELK